MKRKIALGPGAASLILIIVLLSLSMLAMLTQISSRNDYSLASRAAQMTARVYELSSGSERRLAELDAVLLRCLAETQDEDEYRTLIKENLPEGFEIPDEENPDEVTWKEPLDNRTLTCTVRILPPGEGKRTEWVAHKLVVEEPEEEFE